jgi:hypothetical protein
MLPCVNRGDLHCGIPLKNKYHNAKTRIEKRTTGDISFYTFSTWAPPLKPRSGFICAKIDNK